MSVIYEKSSYLNDVRRHYCPGCTHGIVHKLVGEALDELGLVDDTITVVSIGCSGLLYNYIKTDAVLSLHGRAPAVATGVKAVHPDKIVYTHQGDGDLISIGTGETVSAAARGENITVIFINNNIYGMTGGQMSATTTVGAKATTAPMGREPKKHGYPVGVCELLTPLEGTKFIARVSLHDIKHVNQARKIIKKAFEYQAEGKGYAFVEVLSACPTNWKMNPVDAMKWIGTEMVKTYPLGIFKEVE